MLIRTKSSMPRAITALRFAKLSLAQPRLLILAIFFALISSCSAALWPLLLGKVIDALSFKNSAFLHYVFYLGLAEAVRLLATFWQNYLFQTLGQKILFTLRQDLLHRVLHLPAKSLDMLSSGNISTRLSNDVAAVGALFNAGFVRVIERSLSILGILVGMLLLDGHLTLLCLAFFAIFTIFAILISSRLYQAYAKIRSVIGEFNSFLTERLGGISTLHAYNCESNEIESAKRICAEMRESQFRPIAIFGYLHAAMTLTIGSCMAFLIYYGGGLVQSGAISIGVLVTMTSYVLWILWPLMTIINEWYVFLAGMAAAERVFEALDWPVESQVNEMSPTFNKFSGKLEFRDVWFAYKGSEWVLKGVSFKIEAGQKIAIVGPTGSGKSTILGLLLKLYEPQRGDILIDGVQIKSIPPSVLRNLFGLIQQDIFLFSGTVRDNVNLWQDKELHLIIDLSPDLLLTERGSNISMGQRQALAFSRVAAKNPQVWLVDEATSYLDPALDRNLEKKLSEISMGRTRITVAHRLANLSKSDNILVINQGKVVESGTHSDLLKLEGLYAKLFNLQSQAQTQLQN